MGRAPPSHVRVSRRAQRGLRLRVGLFDLAQVRRQLAARAVVVAAQQGVPLLCNTASVSGARRGGARRRGRSSIHYIPSIVIRLAASGSRKVRARSCSESLAARAQ